MTGYAKTGLIVAAAFLIGGCGAVPLRPVHERRSPGLMAGAGAGSWEAVLPGPQVVAAGGTTPGSEYNRRDNDLGYRPSRALTALDSWPTPEKPDLSRWRRVYLPRDAQSFIYFEQGRRSRGSYGPTPRYDRYGRGGQY